MARLRLKLEIKNHGRTAATVIRVTMKSIIRKATQPLPDVPDYSLVGEQKRMSAVLVEDGEFFLPSTFAITTWEVGQIRAAKRKLTLYGFVDYADVFNQKFRSGFARDYNPAKDIRNPSMSDEDFESRSNLSFVSERGYIYDRPLEKDEDHDEPAGLSQPS